MKKSPVTYLTFMALATMAFLGSTHAATIQEWLFDQTPVGAAFATVNEVPGGATPFQQQNVTNTYLNLQVPGGKFPQSTGMLDLHLAKNSASGTGGIVWSSITQFTIELWVNPATMTTGTSMDVFNYGSQIMRLTSTGSGYKLAAYLFNGGFIAATSTATNIPSNTWTQIAMTWNGSTLITYENGIQDISVPTGVTTLTGSTSLSIGASGTGGQGQYYGYIDEMRVSNVALLPGTGTGVNELAWNASLVAVPEPGTTALLLGAGGLMAWVVRRKKR
ncbi:MAG: LamG-like jellyroll fold domain-containing protein, partial [Chthoniobacterales bacterium]